MDETDDPCGDSSCRDLPESAGTSHKKKTGLHRIRRNGWRSWRIVWNCTMYISGANFLLDLCQISVIRMRILIEFSLPPV